MTPVDVTTEKGGSASTPIDVTREKEGSASDAYRRR